MQARVLVKRTRDNGNSHDVKTIAAIMKVKGIISRQIIALFMDMLVPATLVRDALLKQSNTSRDAPNIQYIELISCISIVTMIIHLTKNQFPSTVYYQNR